MKLLVTGGAGFIGSNFVRHVVAIRPEWEVVVLDKLTYSGNRANLDGLEESGRMRFIEGDICDADTVKEAAAGCDAILNFAAETHVDRSILDSSDFVRTDVEGTRTLLEAVRQTDARLVQISTDEVYGDIAEGERSKESDPVRPRSPYSATKAAGDLMVQAYHSTFGVNAVITRCSNNFGPYQFPEKLVPLFATNAFQGLPMPVYGDGLQQRDWLYVEDHCSALVLVLERGADGETYNIGSGTERTNMEIVEEIVRLTAADPDLVAHVEDRAGHDRRYALDCSKVRALGWSPACSFADALARTIDWYRNNEDWWRACRDAEFERYYERQYAGRLSGVGA